MNKNTKGQSGIKVLSSVKAGGLTGNHSRRGLSIRTGIKGGTGIYAHNHNRRLASTKGQSGIKVLSSVKAGGLTGNHNRRLA
jgi:hypothetical protein